MYGIAGMCNAFFDGIYYETQYFQGVGADQISTMRASNNGAAPTRAKKAVSNGKTPGGWHALSKVGPGFDKSKGIDEIKQAKNFKVCLIFV